MKILADIAHHGIQIFQPPQYENEDEETIQENEEIIVSPQRWSITLSAVSCIWLFGA